MFRGLIVFGVLMAFLRPGVADDQVLSYDQYWQLNKSQPEAAQAYALGLVKQVFSRYGVGWPCVWKSSGEVVPDSLILQAFDLDAYGFWNSRTDKATLEAMRRGELPPAYTAHADEPTTLSAAVVLITLDYGCAKT